MENTRKENTYKAATAALILLAIFLLAKSVSELKSWSLIGKDIPPQATINVQGKGEVIVKPDIATFYFGIQEEDLVVANAQDKVAKTEKEVIVFLEKGGVSKDDIKVSGYNIYPRYDYEYNGRVYNNNGPFPLPPLPGGGGKQILSAYVVTESVEVKVRKLTDAGKLIGQMGELGVTNLSGLTFSVDKEQDAIKEARRKAIADAREQADKLAKDLGVSIVRVVSFSDNGNYPMPYYAKEAYATADSRGGVATPELPSGTNTITSNVSITYEIR